MNKQTKFFTFIGILILILALAGCMSDEEWNQWLSEDAENEPTISEPTATPKPKATKAPTKQVTKATAVKTSAKTAVKTTVKTAVPAATKTAMAKTAQAKTAVAKTKTAAAKPTQTPIKPTSVKSTLTSAPTQPSAAKKYTVDTGFRPSMNGFSFANYGNEENTTDLTPAEMRRMFGDAVCAGSIKDDTCNLTPPAKKWMNENNKDMGGGHCEGFAVLSQLFYANKMTPLQFGSATTSQLKLSKNTPLQREIAYWWATQGPTWDDNIEVSASKQVKFLIDAYTKDPRTLYRVGVANADGSDAHAVTAYAVDDRGNGIYRIMVYDNNYPGEERYVEVNTKKETWQYEGGDPANDDSYIYKGNESNYLSLEADKPRMGVLPCDFCKKSSRADKGGAGLAEPVLYNQIWSDGGIPLLLKDENGKKYGYENGEFLKEIPEVSLKPVRSGPRLQSKTNEYVSPVFNVRQGKNITVILNGDAARSEKPTDVVMIGPGYYIGIEEISVEAGQTDTIDFDGQGDFLTYTTDAEETPYITVGIEKDEADYELNVQAVSLEAGSDIFVEFNSEENYMAVSSTSSETASFLMDITRIDDENEETFGTDENEPLELYPGEVIYFYFGKWQGTGSNLEIGIDQDHDGVVDEEIEVEGAE